MNEKFNMKGWRTMDSAPTTGPLGDGYLLSKLIEDEVSAALVDGWDGVGSFAVSSDTHQRAIDIVSLLPSILPIPDVSVTPSGSIAFSWDKGVLNQLSIITGSNGGIGFAALFDGDRLQGTLRFESDRLPNEVLAAIKRWDQAGDGDTATA